MKLIAWQLAGFGVWLLLLIFGATKYHLWITQLAAGMLWFRGYLFNES